MPAFVSFPAFLSIGCDPLWALALPVVAMLYLVFTFDSAYQYAKKRGGAWKGRTQAEVSK